VSRGSLRKAARGRRARRRRRRKKKRIGVD
jgi:hypothetical protein